MPYSHLTVVLHGSAAIVTLDRPAQRNALSLALMREMIECLSELERNREARSIILAAAGPAFGERFVLLLGLVDRALRFLGRHVRFGHLNLCQRLGDTRIKLCLLHLEAGHELLHFGLGFFALLLALLSFCVVPSSLILRI